MRQLKYLSKRWTRVLWKNMAGIIVTSLMMFSSSVIGANWEGDPNSATNNYGKVFRVVYPTALPSEGATVINISMPASASIMQSGPSNSFYMDLIVHLGNRSISSRGKPISDGWELSSGLGLEEYGINRVVVTRTERKQDVEGEAWFNGPYTCGATGSGIATCNGEINWFVPNAKNSIGTMGVEITIFDVKKFYAALYSNPNSARFGRLEIVSVILNGSGITFTKAISVAFPAMGCQFTINGGTIDFGDISDKKIQGESLLAQYGPQVHGSIDCPYENVSPGRYSVQLSQTSNGILEPIYLKNENGDTLGWIDGLVESGNNSSSELCIGTVPGIQPLAQWLPKQNDVLSVTWGLCNNSVTQLPTGEYIGQGYLSVYLQ